MKTLYQPLLLLISALALAGTAFAQVPSTNDTSTTDGNSNTGMGTGALGGPATTNGGRYNTASGFDALANNTTGSNNTASGYQALLSNTSGTDNTAFGYVALNLNTTGFGNTAFGLQALLSNTTGQSNTASGLSALVSNTTGDFNTASGFDALANNTTGNYNTAFGVAALDLNTGSDNTASGTYALMDNSTGSNNTATGMYALSLNQTGSNNVAAGYQAGYYITGSNNIDIGNAGGKADNGIIRIGFSGIHKAAFIAGIYGTPVSGSAVMINSKGRLGVVSSSERFKTAITPMGSNTTKLEQLRPVTFHLKTDPKGALQYGLIAEEVAKVYPELVIRSESGRIDGVRYDELAPMLLNEMQQQAAEIRRLKQQENTVGEMQKQLADMHAALLKLEAKEEFIAKR